jgi:hypothetical protein
MKIIHSDIASPSSTTSMGPVAEHPHGGDRHGGPLADPVLQRLTGIHQLGVGAERRRVQERAAVDAREVDRHRGPRRHRRRRVLRRRQAEVPSQVVERPARDGHHGQVVLGGDRRRPVDGAVAPSGTDGHDVVAGGGSPQDRLQVGGVVELHDLRLGQQRAQLGGQLLARGARSGVHRHHDPGPGGVGRQVEAAHLPHLRGSTAVAPSAEEQRTSDGAGRRHEREA